MPDQPGTAQFQSSPVTKDGRYDMRVIDIDV